MDPIAFAVGGFPNDFVRKVSVQKRNFEVLGW